MENINLKALTNVERILIEEDFDFYQVKYNSPLSNIKNNLTILFKNKELPVLDRVNYFITVSFFGDIYFRKDYKDEKKISNTYGANIKSKLALS